MNLDIPGQKKHLVVTVKENNEKLTAFNESSIVKLIGYL